MDTKASAEYCHSPCCPLERIKAIAGTGKTTSDYLAAMGLKMHHCGGCGTVSYCCRQCQKNHWPEHKACCLSQHRVELSRVLIIEAMITKPGKLQDVVYQQLKQAMTTKGDSHFVIIWTEQCFDKDKPESTTPSPDAPDKLTMATLARADYRDICRGIGVIDDQGRPCYLLVLCHPTKGDTGGLGITRCILVPKSVIVKTSPADPSQAAPTASS